MRSRHRKPGTSAAANENAEEGYRPIGNARVTGCGKAWILSGRGARRGADAAHSVVRRGGGRRAVRTKRIGGAGGRNNVKGDEK